MNSPGESFRECHEVLRVGVEGLQTCVDCPKRSWLARAALKAFMGGAHQTCQSGPVDVVREPICGDEVILLK